MPFLCNKYSKSSDKIPNLKNVRVWFGNFEMFEVRFGGRSEELKSSGSSVMEKFAVFFFSTYFVKFGSGLCDAEVRDNKVRKFWVHFGFTPSLI